MLGGFRRILPEPALRRNAQAALRVQTPAAWAWFREDATTTFAVVWRVKAKQRSANRS